MNIYLNLIENSYLNYLDIYWTNLIYNYLFMSTVLIFCSFYLNIYYNKIHVTWLWVFILLFFNFIYNYNIDYNFFNQTINLLLNNKLNLIHPPLIYLYNICIILIYYWCNNNYMYFKYVQFIILLFYISINVIYLGCWWSLQEDNWNEWWGWEFSEILSLINLISCLLIMHKNKFYKNISYLYIFKNFIYWYLIINFFFVQIYLDDTMHNFINYLNLTIIFWLITFIYLFKNITVSCFTSHQIIFVKFFNFFSILNLIVIIIYSINFIYLYLYWYLTNSIKAVECDYSLYIYCLLYITILLIYTPNTKSTYLLKYHYILFLIIFYLLNTWNFHLEYFQNNYLYNINTNINKFYNFIINTSFYYKTIVLFINNIFTEFCLNLSYFYIINLLFIIHLWLLCNIIYFTYVYYKNVLWY